MPNIPLDLFRTCVFGAPLTHEWAYRAQVAFAGIYYSPPRSYPDISRLYRHCRLRLRCRLHIQA